MKTINLILLLVLVLIVNSDLRGQWLQIPMDSSLQLSNVDFPSPAVGYVSANRDIFLSDFLLKTDNAGATWDTLPVPTPTGFTTTIDKMQFLDESTGFVAGCLFDTSMVFPIGLTFALKTFDGGLTWTDISPDSVWLGFPKLAFHSPDNGLIVGVEDQRKTTDGGANWETTLLTNRSAFDLEFPSPDTGYMGGFELSPTMAGWLVKTDNGGDSWTVIDVSAYGFSLIRHFSFLSTQTGFVYGEATGVKKILKTTDGGLSWSDIPFTPETPTEMVFVDENKGFILESNLGIAHTLDGGLSWTLELSTPFGEQLQDLFFRGNDGYACGTNGQLFRFEGTNGIMDDISTLEVKVYPNPASDFISIEWEGIQTPILSYQIVDLQAKQVMRAETGKWKKDKNGIQIDVSQLPEGSYYLELKTASQVSGQLLVVSRR